MTQADQPQQANEINYVAPFLPANFYKELMEEEPGYNSLNPTSPFGNHFISEIDNHYGLMSVFAHGGPTGMSVTTKGVNLTGPDYKHNVFSLNELDEGASKHYTIATESANGFDNMTNVNHPGVFYTVTCNSTPFDHDLFRTEVTVNLGMGWTTNTNVGGPIFLGHTRYGQPIASAKIYKQFAILITSGTTYNFGELEATSKSICNYHYPNYSHNLVGCPETEIWTDIPQEFNNVEIDEYSNYIEVTPNVANCKVCVMSALDNGGSYFDPRDEGESEYIFYNVPELYLVTITKHDYLPYIQNPDNIYIQNDLIYEQRYIYGNNFFAGSNVTTSWPPGPAIIKNGANIVFDADNEVSLMEGFEVELGGEFEIK